MGLWIATVAGVGGWGAGGVSGVVGGGEGARGHIPLLTTKMQHGGREAVWVWRGQWRRFGRVGGMEEIWWGGWRRGSGVRWEWGHFRGRFCPVRSVSSFGLAVKRVY